jgi:hypothetical protein
MSLLEGKSKAELDFIKERARMYLVKWCDQQIQNAPCDFGGGPVFLEFAQSKGWVSKKEPLKVLATGFNTAAAFLRR